MDYDPFAARADVIPVRCPGRPGALSETGDPLETIASVSSRTRIAMPCRGTRGTPSRRCGLPLWNQRVMRMPRESRG